MIKYFPKLILTTVLSLGLFFLANQVQAATITWTGGGTTNNWSELANWTPAQVPASTDDVVFSASSTKNSTWDASGPSQIKSLTVGSDYTGTLTLARDVTVAGDWTYNGSNFDAGTSTVKFTSITNITFV
ncbi:hypothetical protein D6821_01680, partial [Candidatus Parcubacteria bacterium]